MKRFEVGDYVRFRDTDKWYRGESGTIMRTFQTEQRIFEVRIDRLGDRRVTVIAAQIAHRYTSHVS